MPKVIKPGSSKFEVFPQSQKYTYLHEYLIRNEDIEISYGQ